MKPLSVRIRAPQSLANQVAARLREAIVNCEVKLGELIAEESLAAAFGVSRTPVREALNLLQVEGLVDVRPQRGSYVFEPDEADIRALCEFRCVIEPRAGQLAHGLDRDSLLAAMRSAVHGLETSREARDPMASSRADTRFHESLLDYCGNPYLQSAYSLAAARIASLRTQLPLDVDVISQEGIEQHRQVLQHLEAANWPAFRKALHRHINDACDGYIARLKVLEESRARDRTTADQEARRPARPDQSRSIRQLPRTGG
jgi:DNA-binding GntR family transcriptional regulator